MPEIFSFINDRSTNWTVVPYPTQRWATRVFPRLDPEEALARLEAQIAHVCRLDEPDPAAAWAERADGLEAVARRPAARRFDASHFEGAGTHPPARLPPPPRRGGA